MENNQVTNTKKDKKSIVSTVAIIAVGAFAILLGSLFLIDNGSGQTIFALSNESFLPLALQKMIYFLFIIGGALLILVKVWSPAKVEPIVYTTSTKKVKENADEEPVKKGFWAIFAKEYKYENLILALLAVFAIVLGALLLTGNDGEPVLTISEDFPVLGDFPKLFAWLLIGLGAISVLLVAWPFYKPSFAEIKHLKGYKRSEFFLNVARVLIFTVIFCGFIILFDLVIQWVPTWFE